MASDREAQSIRSAFPVLVGVLLTLPASALLPEPAAPVRWVVGFHAAPDASFLPGEVVRTDEALRFAVVVSDDPDFARAIASDPRVRYVEQDSLVRLLHTPNDPKWAASTHHGPRLMQAPAAWDVARGASSTILCVLDTGLRATHEDLAGPRLLGGTDFVNDDNDPRDDQGHGTLVTSLAAATMDNGKGIAGLAQVSVLMGKVMNAAGQGFQSDAASGMRWCADRGAHVISMSFGATSGGTTGADAAAYARGRGAVLFGGSGNDGCDNCVYFPGAYPDVLAVGCVTSAKARCYFSNGGPELDLAAPGMTIEGAAHSADNAYEVAQGTSLSTPLAAGAAALAKASNPALSGEDLRALILNGAEDLGVSGRDNGFGYGLVRVDRMVSNSVPVIRPPACDRNPAAEASEVRCRFRADDASPGVVYTIDWGDGSVEVFPGSGSVPPNVDAMVPHVWPSAGLYMITAYATDTHPGGGLTSAPRTGQVRIQANAPPAPPTIACSPANSLPGETVLCSLASIDDSAGLAYSVDFGDGTGPQRVPPTGVLPTGTPAAVTHAWSARGAYTIVATATDDAAAPLTSAPSALAHDVVGCRFHAEGSLVAPRGEVVFVNGVTAQRIIFPRACEGTSFSLRGSGGFDDFDVCWRRDGTELRCDQRVGPEAGAVPATANGAEIQYAVGASGRWVLDIPAAPPIPEGDVVLARDDGELDRWFPLGDVFDVAEKDFVAPVFVPGLDFPTATARILGQAGEECFPDTPTMQLQMNGVPFASFDPCDAFPASGFAYAEFALPIALVSSGSVNTMKMVKVLSPPGFGDAILAVDDSEAVTSRIEYDGIPVAGELMWEIRLEREAALA